jgi:hypothetical protein
LCCSILYKILSSLKPSKQSSPSPMCTQIRRQILEKHDIQSQQCALAAATDYSRRAYRSHCATCQGHYGCSSLLSDSAPCKSCACPICLSPHGLAPLHFPHPKCALPKSKSNGAAAWEDAPAESVVTEDKERLHEANVFAGRSKRWRKCNITWQVFRREGKLCGYVEGVKGCGRGRATLRGNYAVRLFFGFFSAVRSHQTKLPHSENCWRACCSGEQNPEPRGAGWHWRANCPPKHQGLAGRLRFFTRF